MGREKGSVCASWRGGMEGVQVHGTGQSVNLLKSARRGGRQRPLDGCAVVPAKPNPDARGCLYEIYRAEWPGAFPTVQWNACISKAGVIRGVHVHVDYEEYYALLAGRGILGLHDIRRESSTFGRSVTIDWRADDRSAIAIPRGVAHVLWFMEDAVLAFGVSSYWRAELDVVGCRWDDPALGLEMPDGAKSLSQRDTDSGSYQEMVHSYETLLARYSRQAVEA